MVLNLSLSRLGVTSKTEPTVETLVKTASTVETSVKTEPTVETSVKTTVETSVKTASTVVAKRRSIHQVVRSLKAFGSLTDRAGSILAGREALQKINADLMRIKPEDRLGDFRAFPDLAVLLNAKRQGWIAQATVRVNAGGIFGWGLSPAEMTILSAGDWGRGSRSLYQQLLSKASTLDVAIKGAEQAYLQQRREAFGLVVPTLSETAYKLLDKKRESLAAERASLQGVEWYLATTPTVLTAQQDEIDATTAKVVKAKTALKAANDRLAQLNVELGKAADEVFREELRRAKSACKKQIEALGNQVGNLSTKLANQKAEANPFLKDGVKLADRPAESVAEWLSASLPDFAANAAAEIAELRDQALQYTYWSARFELAESELPRIAAAVAAAKLPTKCVEHIVQDVKFGRLNILTAGSLETAIAEQSEITRNIWRRRIPGANRSIREVLDLVQKFLRLATAGELTSLDAVNRVHQILSHLEGEGKIIATLAEAKALDPAWFVTSEGRALVVPNLPKLVLTFITDGKTELSAVSQVKLLPEWFEPPVADKRSGRNIAPVAPVSEVVTETAPETMPETMPEPVDTRTSTELLAARF